MPQINHRTLGLRCRIGDTDHPVARQHRHALCTIQAVWRFGPVLMASIALPSGEVINGLFFYELEDDDGQSLYYKQ